MTPNELSAKCVASGFIPESIQKQASLALSDAYKKKGQYAVEEKILRRMEKSPIRSVYVLHMILDEIPDEEPYEEPAKKEAKADLEIPLTIEQEISMEKADLKTHEELLAMLNKLGGPRKADFRVPNDPAFDESPSIFDCEPYRSFDEDMKAEYKRNVFMKVMSDAVAKKTSMHEICRERGLDYGLLLI